MPVPGITSSVPIPTATGPLATNDDSYPFSTMRHATVPVDLASCGYVEEEYLLEGQAHTYTRQGRSAVASGGTTKYVTRVLVRRPSEHGSGVAWVSLLNASQGYDIEDDWRRAWDFMIARRDTYVAITAKPINADALRIADSERYGTLTWGGELPGLVAYPGWDPFQVIAGSEEGLAWDVIAQTAAWLRSGTNLPQPRRVVLMGQSQSGAYTNTYLTFFHDLFRMASGGPLFDAYLPGAASVFGRELTQSAEGDPQFRPVLFEPAQIDAPVIVVSTDADVALFGGRADAFRLGDGPLRRHWHVAGAPHSDARSAVIPANSEIERARRLPRMMDDALLASLNIVPVEPVVTAAMAAVLAWLDEGVPAAPSLWFDEATGGIARDASGVAVGGIRLGLVEEPLAVFHGASADNPVIGAMELADADVVVARYGDLATYQAACDRHDDGLQRAGYLEPHGRVLLRAIEAELWHRVVDGAAPLRTTPQSPLH